MEYTKLDLEHAKILEDLTAMCRSNRNQFTVDDRIQIIRSKLKETNYQEYKGDNSVNEEENAPFSLWSKTPIDELPEDVILISTHCDIVPSINTCSSTLEENGFYLGTYDNIGTNAAALILMTEHEMPDNVVFAFTGDEETGRCSGAKMAAKYLAENGKNPTCLALDVTYEGFFDNRLWSLENCSLSEDKNEEQLLDFLNHISQSAVKTDNEQSFCFVRASRYHNPDKLENKYLSKSYGMYDEAFAYRDAGFPAMSLCLPCYGNMHGESGVRIKQPVFEGYILSLASFIYSLTQTHTQLIDAYKIAKDNLIMQASEIQYKNPYNYYYSNDDYEEDDEYDEYDEYDDDEYDYDDDIEFDEEIAYYLSPIMNVLYAEAVTYDATEEELFIENTDIPYEYMKKIVSDPDGAILKEERERIDSFLRDVFRDVHGLKEEYDKEDETEFYFGYLNKLAKERYDDEDYEERYSDM